MRRHPSNYGLEDACAAVGYRELITVLAVKPVTANNTIAATKVSLTINYLPLNGASYATSVTSAVKLAAVFK
jgi:hypothetical protein